MAVGQFTNCADDWAISVADVLTERLGDLGVPVLGGQPIGHGLRSIGQITSMSTCRPSDVITVVTPYLLAYRRTSRATRTARLIASAWLT